MKDLSKRVESRRTWNFSKFLKNLITTFIFGAIITASVLGLVWGLEQEQNINTQQTKVFLQE